MLQKVFIAAVEFATPSCSYEQKQTGQRPIETTALIRHLAHFGCILNTIGSGALEIEESGAMSVSDVIFWLLLVVLSVLIFFLLPLAGGLAHLNRSGLKLIIAGIPIVIKLLHSVFSDQNPKSESFWFPRWVL